MLWTTKLYNWCTFSWLGSTLVAYRNDSVMWTRFKPSPALIYLGHITFVDVMSSSASLQGRWTWKYLLSFYFWYFLYFVGVSGPKGVSAVVAFAALTTFCFLRITRHLDIFLPSTSTQDTNDGSLVLRSSPHLHQRLSSAFCSPILLLPQWRHLHVFMHGSPCLTQGHLEAFPSSALQENWSLDLTLLPQLQPFLPGVVITHSVSSSSRKKVNPLLLRCSWPLP